MRPFWNTVALLSIFGLCSVTSDEDAVFSCNCEYCDEEKVIGLGENSTTPTRQVMYEEDSDDDGNRTICARNRDFNDRTFTSVCQMLCYNHCTRYRMVAVNVNDVRKYVMIAFRPNYYKLKDGAC